jgi:hypothetical protein
MSPVTPRCVRQRTEGTVDPGDHGSNDRSRSENSENLATVGRREVASNQIRPAFAEVGEFQFACQ